MMKNFTKTLRLTTILLCTTLVGLVQGEPVTHCCANWEQTPFRETVSPSSECRMKENCRGKKGWFMKEEPSSKTDCVKEEPSRMKADWILEAEDSTTTVEWHDSIAEIHSPKGMTLWYRHAFEGDVVIEYDAMVVVEDSTDRLSDLNCFWMATDPSVPDCNVLTNIPLRHGIFKNCYSLQLYYVGYGGNYNSTTRFRRYDGVSGNPFLATNDVSTVPAILTEYTDSLHLLRPNHWYHIRLESIDGRVRYQLDNEILVDYTDSAPLTRGWFGLRTTWAHLLFRPRF